MLVDIPELLWIQKLQRLIVKIKMIFTMKITKLSQILKILRFYNVMLIPLKAIDTFYLDLATFHFGMPQNHY